MEGGGARKKRVEEENNVRDRMEMEKREGEGQTVSKQDFEFECVSHERY